MASYDYNIAKDVLSDNDKNRLVCLWLNRTPDGQVDWDKASADFGCASVNSMKVSTGNIMKTIEKAGGKTGGTTTGTPKKATPAKKRKAAGGDDDDQEATPKKQGRKGKTPKEDFAKEDADESAIKGEPTSEGGSEAETAA